MTKIGWRSAFSLEHKSEEIDILRIIARHNSEWSIPEARKIHQERIQLKETAMKAEYYTILNENPDLEERRLKLVEHIGELGFDGLWHESMSKHRKSTHLPEKIEEEIWYNASQEIRKIDMILAARVAKEEVE